MQSREAFITFLTLILVFMGICLFFIIKTMRDKKINAEDRQKKIDQWDYYSKLATAIGLVVFTLILFIKRMKGL
jgi:uncharacterized membrane protein